MQDPLNPLFSALYGRLKDMARRQRTRHGAEESFSTTELVHEAYVRMDGNFHSGHPAQFFAYAARTMRHVMADAARRRMQHKRGGGTPHVDLDHAAVDDVSVDTQLALQFDQALTALAQDDSRAATIVEMHFFAGIGLQAIADLLGLTRRTIDRDWQYARAFLANTVVA